MPFTDAEKKAMKDKQFKKGGGSDDKSKQCCCPTWLSHGCGMGGNITDEQMFCAVRLVCTNAECPHSPGADGITWMHDECFDKFEDMALTSLQKTGRARNWTSTQAIANLWTKKGYDVIIKSCGCRCDNGFVRKDLDYRPPKVQVEKEAEAAKPKKAKDSKQEEQKKKELEKKAKKVAKRLMEDDDEQEEEEVEYFDRPGSLTLNAVLDGEPQAKPEATEKDKKAAAEKQRLLAKQREEEERRQRQLEMEKRERERQEQERAEKRRKEEERREAVDRAKREEEEERQRRREEDEKKQRQKEKQKQRDEEKKREQAKVEADARERRKKFEEQQRMKAEQDALAEKESEGNDEADEDYRRELQRSLDEAAAAAAQEGSLTEGERSGEGLFWAAETPQPEGTGAGYGYMESFVGNLVEDDGSALRTANYSGANVQIGKLQAQVNSLHETLQHLMTELAHEQSLKQQEEARLEWLRSGMHSRMGDLAAFNQRFADVIGNSS